MLYVLKQEPNTFGNLWSILRLSYCFFFFLVLFCGLFVLFIFLLSLPQISRKTENADFV